MLQLTRSVRLEVQNKFLLLLRFDLVGSLTAKVFVSGPISTATHFASAAQ